MGNRTIQVAQAEAGERIDTFLARKTGLTRSQVQGLMEKGFVSINSRTVDSRCKVKASDLIILAMPEKRTEGLVPQPIPIDILYKDKHLVVVNKPANLVVYPAAGHAEGTLMNALAYCCQRLADVGRPLRPGVVHRLDKDTSGVMVVALDDKAYYSLVEQFRQRTVSRRYIALVYGNLKQDAGEIALPIGRSESDRKKMSTRSGKGRAAVTRWKVLKRFGCATLIEAQLGTGRTHQIRVHLASIGYPVAGDRTYGRKTEIEIKGKRIAIPRQMLHAQILGFEHPFTGEYLEFSGPMPADMQDILSYISRAAGNSGADIWE